MFGALNRFISRLDSEPQAQIAAQQAADTSYGFQVLRNTNPDIPLEPWFDFVVGINGHGIDSPDHNLFSAEIKNCAGNLCSLDLWSAKGQRTHTLTISVPPHRPLGLSFQLAPLSSTQHIWHILTIPSPLSPAHQAGLLPHSDYILGSPSGVLHGESAFGEMVEDHLNRSLSLWVYNSEFDVVREVELIPRRGWGGEGALGAVLGYGALHRLPMGLGEEVQGPGENMFDADSTKHDYTSQPGDAGFIPQPAKTLSPPPMFNPGGSTLPLLDPNAPPPSKISSKKKNRPAATMSGFDDMFEEGQKKSAENDYVPSRKGTPAAPPPPLKGVAPSASPAGNPDEVGEPGDAEKT